MVVLDPLRWTEHKGRRTRRSFTEDYKAGAIRLVLDEGKTVAAAMHEAGLVTDPTIAPRAELARVERAIENLTQPVAEGGDWPSRVGKL